MGDPLSRTKFYSARITAELVRLALERMRGNGPVLLARLEAIAVEDVDRFGAAVAMDICRRQGNHHSMDFGSHIHKEGQSIQLEV